MEKEENILGTEKISKLIKKFTEELEKEKKDDRKINIIHGLFVLHKI